MSEILPPGLMDYRTEFEALEADIQDANITRKPLCPCREPEIQAAINHPFSRWLDRHPSFKAARSKIEVHPYYLGVFAEYRRRWWVELKYKLAGALIQYYGYQMPQVIEGIKSGAIQAPVIAYGKKTKKTKKDRISELATALLDEIQGVYVLPTIARNRQLHILLAELINCLKSGNTSKLSFSKLHKNIAREAMIKRLVVASAIFTGDVFNAIILDLVSIADTTIGRDTVDRFIAEMKPELEEQRKEMMAEVGRLKALDVPLPDLDVCRVCGLPIIQAAT